MKIFPYPNSNQKQQQFLFREAKNVNDISVWVFYRNNIDSIIPDTTYQKGYSPVFFFGGGAILTGHKELVQPAIALAIRKVDKIF